MQKLILFDIDGTLIKSCRVHWESFCEAFSKVYGIETSIDVIDHCGMTDMQVVLNVLEKKGMPRDKILEKIPKTKQVMINYYNENKHKGKVRAYKGVLELLSKLSKDNLLGLVTGNLEPIAYGKLEKANLNQFFKLGGFGSDHMIREELVKIAITRATSQHGFYYENNVILIGDTPKDIEAGKKAGVKTIGVAQKNYSVKELSKADVVLENLSNTEKVFDIINSL
ncbi:MAG: Pyrophosphatase PpaX [Candidatus Woesearchaeota archaeon]|nr:Pyrophosphatase PpaX [Candidatus Woesearchaeota archaeon]